MAAAQTPIRVLGCDVAKDTVTLFDSRTAKTRTVANTQPALRRALAGLEAGTLVVCEATGGHEAALLSVTTDAGLPAHRADPRKASTFRRSLHGHAKTDGIDAQMLARYGQDRAGDLALWQPPSQAQADLRTLVGLHADLVRDRADYTRRLKAPGDGPDKPHIRALLKTLCERIAAVDDDIDRLVQADPSLAQTTEIIKAIPGCGPKTAMTLAATMPELGQLTRRQAAALAGLAPHPNQSGRTDAYRRVRGGRREAKIALFMAAMAARRFNPTLSADYQRLRNNGKKPIVAIIAIARKLITIINARIRDAMRNPNSQLC